jgi:branched-chain amino acid transport system substrate-binding protein
MKHPNFLAAALVAAMVVPSMARADKVYSPGATDTEIKIGQTAPLSGPGSAYGAACPVAQNFFKMINDQGGINGRKLVMFCEDDGFNPAKTVEETRKLVESEQVLLTFASVGSATQLAVQRYMNAKHVPMLLINSGAYKWVDPKSNPWTTIGDPSLRSEAHAFGDFIKKNLPNAKVGILYQNDDYGKDYEVGLRESLGPLADKMLVAEQSYELTDPTLDAQILALRAKGVDVVVLGTLAKQATIAIKKIGDLGWKPQIFMSWTCASIPQVLKPAGLEYSKGLISTAIFKDPADPRWANDKATIDYKNFMAKYMPSADPNYVIHVLNYASASVLMDILKRAGDNLTHENVMKQALSVDMQPLMYLPGIRYRTTPDKRDPISAFQMIRFNGTGWENVGSPIGH